MLISVQIEHGLKNPSSYELLYCLWECSCYYSLDAAVQMVLKVGIVEDPGGQHLY